MKTLTYNGRTFVIKRAGTAYGSLGMEARKAELIENGKVVATGKGRTFGAAARAALYELYPLKRGEIVQIAERSLAGYGTTGKVLSFKGGVLRVQFTQNNIISSNADAGDYERYR